VLRFKVLREPLGLHFSEADLADERENFHLSAFINNELIAVVLLKPIDSSEIKMRQFAVEPEFQNKGIGDQLTRFAENFARSKNYKKISLHARKTAVRFYEKMNYKIVGDEFTEVTIPHYIMIKIL
jgi:ribosomal protein S18 acetylase RimI-like enzyme